MELTYDRSIQPQPKIGPWKDELEQMLDAGGQPRFMDENIGTLRGTLPERPRS